MRFHEYLSFRKRLAKALSSDAYRSAYGAAPLPQVLLTHSDKDIASIIHDEEIAKTTAAIAARKPKAEVDAHWHPAVNALGEQMWHRKQRPFYNVWPIVTDIIANVTLDVSWKQAHVGVNPLVLQFPVGREPLGIRYAMLYSFFENQQAETGLLYHLSAFIEKDDACQLTHTISDPEETVAAYLDKCTSTQILGDGSHIFSANDEAAQGAAISPQRHLSIVRHILTLAAMIRLIENGDDLVTPVLLRKDQERADEIPEEAFAEWQRRKLEKAHNKGVFGFDVGKLEQRQRENNPSYVIPYWAFRRCGKQWADRRFVKISGYERGITEAISPPTGFYGEECPDEFQAFLRCLAEAKDEYVYFLRDGDRPYVKIGYTRRAVGLRREELLTGNRFLRLLGFIPTGDSRRKEKEVHHLLRNTVKDGEFFYLSDQGAREIIENHGGTWVAGT
jgi:hypothetical protein